MPEIPRDPRADRRFAYAQAAAEEGAWQDAAELYEQVLEIAPDWIAAWIGLGDAQAKLGISEKALDAFRRAAALDPQDRHGASLKIAALDRSDRPAHAPFAYVATLFDEYAPRFDAHLQGALHYSGPEDLRAALDEIGRTRFTRAIDLGCGTGLGGVVLRPCCETLYGIDLSPRMVEIARDRGLYDQLAVTDVLSCLAGEADAGAELIFAADVFVYIGDLEPILRECHRVLAKGGMLAFTLQRCEAGITVGEDLRFAHSREVVETLLTRCGFNLLALRDHSTRREKSVPVAGLLCLATT